MHDKKIPRQAITAAVILAVILRLSATGLLTPLVSILQNRQLLSLIVSLETGRIIKPAAIQEEPALTKSITPTQITQRSYPVTRAEDAVISFSPDALSLVEITYYCDYSPDLEALMEAPLTLSLFEHQPTVLIIHSHTTESYTGDIDYVEAYRTLDENANMIAVGAEVARVLELGGVTVIHDTNIYDYPDYNSAYNEARAAIQDWIAEYPGIQLVLDIHRDAAAGDAGQLTTHATVDGQSSCQLMMVVGTDGTGLNHPNWRENLSLAMKLNVVLEQENPGITRPISLRSQRFNEDLTTGSLIIEVGAAGDSLEEARIAANAFARGILTLVGGS